MPHTQICILQEWTIDHWIENGLPKEKVYMGVPTYARTFRVADPSLTGTGVGVRAWGQQTLTYRQVRCAGNNLQRFDGIDLYH